MTSSAAPPRGRLAGLQILRGVAALSIALHHAQHEAGLLAAGAGRAFAPLTVFPWAAGIDLFFVISGFIMVHASGDLFGRAGAPRLFLARRTARIVPLYWLTTTAFLILAVVRPNLLNAPPATPGHALASYAFIPALRSDGAVMPVYSLGWTLNYEMFFYALFALALALPLARRPAVLVLCAALAIIAGAGAVLAPSGAPAAFWTSPIILEFALGMLVGLVRAEGIALPTAWRWTLTLLALGVLFAVGLAAEPDLVRLARPGPALAATLLVAAFVLGGEAAGRDAFLRVGSLIGDASYALYLLHPFAIRGLRVAVEAGGFGRSLGPWFFVAGSLVCAVALAVAVFLVIERPLTRMARRALGA